jgi:putative ABC transport system ATP-binding protein
VFSTAAGPEQFVASTVVSVPRDADPIRQLCCLQRKPACSRLAIMRPSFEKATMTTEPVLNPTEKATQTLVEARRVSKVFRRDSFEVCALDDVSINIAPGEFLALMGPSGSGKTTLLNMIAGIDRPTSGELLVMGENIFRLNETEVARWRNEHIGYVFQTFNLIPVLTAFENVELPLLLTTLSKQERREHVLTALRLVGLEDRVNHLPKQLSGGQEQRVAIARAIVTDPTLIIADEPTGDLDSHSATEVLEIMKMLNEDFQKTVVMVTHDPHAAAYAHTIRHLEKGMLLPV